MIKSISLTEQSSVFFAQFSGIKNGGLIIKSASESVNAIFTHSILNQLDIVRVPDMHCINSGMKQYLELMLAIDKVCVNDQQLKQLVKSNINRPFIILIEYIPGFDFEFVGGERADLLFHPDTLKRNVLFNQNVPRVQGWQQNFHQHAFPVSESPLVQLGKIIAFDIFINNPDRINSIWDNSGNPANILFEVDIKNVSNANEINWFDPESVEQLKIKTIVPIDNMTFPTDSSEELLEYLQKQEIFIQDIFEDIKLIRSMFINGQQKNKISEQQELQKMIFPSMKKVIDFLRFNSNGSPLFHQGIQVLEEYLDGDDQILNMKGTQSNMNYGSQAEAFSQKLLYRQNTQCGRICMQIIVGIMTCFLKISIQGEEVIEISRNHVQQFHGDFDFKGIWKRQVRKFNETLFYQQSINLIQQNLNKNYDELQWLLDYAIASQLIQ